jgi:hypothetical protein
MSLEYIDTALGDGILIHLQNGQLVSEVNGPYVVTDPFAVIIYA